MAENIIRQDIVQIGFDIGDSLKELQKLTDEVNDLKKKLTGGVGEDAFDDLKDNATKSQKPIEKVKENVEKAKKSLTEMGKKAATTAFNGLKKLASLSFKGLTVGIGAAATAIGGLVAKSVSAFADFEQLKGGVDTLFKKSSGTVLKYANNAYKTAGLSANEYMETVTSFSASLLQSLKGDTEKAAKYADMAISDMSDNANKMGTDMGSLQYAYQGFAKQNYTMLDNLKLGYGGTKTEMQRLVKDAAKLDKSVNANSLSYANIVKAIHAVQVEMGVYGTTQKEAEHTVTGSLNSMKSAWGNLLTAIGSGENLDQCFENMISTVEIFGDNIIPVIERSLAGMGTVVEKIAPKIAEILPDLAKKLIPPLIKAAVELTKGLIKALPNIIKTLAVAIVDIFGEQFPIIKKIGDFFKNNAGTIADSLKKIIPVVIALVAAFKGFNAIKGVMSFFGGLKSGGGSKGGFMSGLTNAFKGLANTKTSTVLKGVANLSIILGSLGALLWIATKVFKNGIDFKEMAQVVILIGGLGLVGLELGKLAGIVGKIPIPTVLKGLANMAIILVGIGALLFTATKVFKDGVNFKEMVQVIALMGILGTVGAALSIFAGVVGMIPIPVVLAGLASMALVLGGITGLIVAFGALSEVKGFNDFIDKGGEVMVKIFNTLGKMGGALIGGIGEGVSESLPKIGENITKFATSLKPMFTMFKGVDASGMGSFFKALGSFMLQMAGNDILSFFTGGTNFAKLGKELNEFATNSKGFFTTVAQLPENGFTNGTKLFNCLAGIKSLPKEGGVVGWFKGDISYASMADGLAQLASEKVVTFFNTVAGLKQEGFDMATKMFECFAGLKSLPKEGGVVGWFSGEVSYKNIAAGLETLSSEGVKNFFTMVSGLDPKAFENTKLLFESLASIGKLPKEGGFWDKLTGDESTSLSNLASGLSTFAEKTKTFFEQVNSLNLEQLNGLWDSLKKIEEVPTQIQNIVTGSNTALSDGFTKMINTVKVQGAAMVNSLSTTMKQLKTVVASTDLSSAGMQMINGLIRGMNSKKGAAVSTARSIANAINAEYRKVQAIKSPSREWESYGEYQIQGGVNGMENKLPLLKATVQKIGEYSLPYGGSYTPENSVTTNNRSSVSETNHYSPQFNLTISGTSDDRATARKVKKWVAEALEDVFTNLDNKNPKLREV